MSKTPGHFLQKLEVKVRKENLELEKYGKNTAPE
jgi:hypothetical protein